MHSIVKDERSVDGKIFLIRCSAMLSLTCDEGDYSHVPANKTEQ